MAKPHTAPPSNDQTHDQTHYSPHAGEWTAGITERVVNTGIGAKLLGVGCIFLFFALISIGLTLWVTWQMEGGAAAVNEAGRMRMRSYLLVLSLKESPPPDASRLPQTIQSQLDGFDESLELLRTGDQSRPLAVPWDADTRQHFQNVVHHWHGLRAQIHARAPATQTPLLQRQDVEPLVNAIDAFVSSIERHLSRWTQLLRGYLLALMALATLSALALFYVGHIMVLEPISRIQRGLRRIQDGDFGARVDVPSRDELGLLADGFNSMAEHLQALYDNLESKVREKTASLETQQQRLSALYEVAAFAARAETLDELAQGFARQIRRIANADATAIRWSDQANERYMLLASDCLPHAMAESEQCISSGDCHCGPSILPGASTHLRVIPIAHTATADPSLPAPARTVHERCAREGYATLVSIPVSLHQRMLGEVDLFFRGEPALSNDERDLFEALASHLAGAMESLRSAALNREAAVADERQLLAQELHDSIAQSLAFLKIQMQLLRDAMAKNNTTAIANSMNELDAGLRESYSDVRELLLHFRVRTSAEDFEPALRETLSKFEHQTGLHAQLTLAGQGLPLPADVQIQVLHIVQEALSNVRKHANAQNVWVEVITQPDWRVSVRDDGRGFDTDSSAPDSTHIGLRIMKERAARIGARVSVYSSASGTIVELHLPRASSSHHASDRV